MILEDGYLLYLWLPYCEDPQEHSHWDSVFSEAIPYGGIFLFLSSVRYDFSSHLEFVDHWVVLLSALVLKLELEKKVLDMTIEEVASIYMAHLPCNACGGDAASF